MLENKIEQSFTTERDIKFKDSISPAYAKLESELENQQLSPLQNWIKHIVAINARYYANLNKGNERDSCMANNLVWLAEKFYPNEKIIVWAHNAHIAKNSSSKARFMGNIINEHFGSQLFTIGLYMVNGTTALNSRKVITVKEPVKNSLESELGARGFKAAFIETNNLLFDKQIKTYHWGKDVQKLNLHKSFDAVILINGVSAPVYLKE